MKTLSTACLALLSMLLMSCGTSPPVHYYSLEPDTVASVSNGPDSVIVGMGPFRIPDYLKRTRMVTRGLGSEIVVHENTRWAEPVGDAIHRVLAANVDHRLNDAIFLAYPYLESVSVAYAVVGQVERFDCDAAGNVSLFVQWGVQDKARESLIAPQRARYETRAGDPNDPDQVARAMNEALNRFSADIADQLRKSLDRLSAQDPAQ